MQSQNQWKVGDFYHESLMGLTPKERRDVMEGLAYKVTTEGYTKRLNENELIDKKSILAEISIEIAELEEKKRELMAQIKAEMELPAATKKELLSAIKHKSEFRQGILYYVDDQETGTMYIFDESAECVDARPLRQEEKQTRIRNLNTGTDGQ